MAWFTRFTRFGDMHFVYAQEAENSCGIACVMMSVFKMNKLAPGKAALHTEKNIYKAYSKQSGSAYDGSGYSYTNHLASTLNQLNVGKWKQEKLDLTKVSAKILDVVGTEGAFGPIVNVKPIIILVDWDARGAHFVVVDTVRKFAGNTYATVCDPWDGDVHVTKFAKGSAFKYHASPVFGSWDLGGKKHDYKGSKSGQIGGWVVYPT